MTANFFGALLALTLIPLAGCASGSGSVVAVHTTNSIPVITNTPPSITNAENILSPRWSRPVMVWQQYRASVWHVVTVNSNWNVETKWADTLYPRELANEAEVWTTNQQLVFDSRTYDVDHFGVDPTQWRDSNGWSHVWLRFPNRFWTNDAGTVFGSIQ